jgi:RecB family exonuclease
MVLEGIVDLIYEEDDGSLVVVDYKTDAIPAAALDVRAKFYEPQIASYLSCLEAAGCEPDNGRLLFLNPGAAVEIGSSARAADG